MLRAALAARPAILLTGARQTGKTSLIQQTFPDLPTVSFDLPSVAEAAEITPEAFLAQHPPPLMIDEVQYAPALFRHLKIAIDQQRRDRGLYVLTGSQPLALMAKASESLAGRIGILSLETLAYAAELRKAWENQGQKTPLYFWRDRQREVDFLIPKGGQYHVMEAKWREKPDRGDLKGMQAFAAVVGTENALSTRVICRTAHAFPVTRAVQAVPLAAGIPGG